MKKRNEKVIPIKHGGPHRNVEAFANLENGTVQRRPWSMGPTNEFTGDTLIRVFPKGNSYGEEYERIFGHP